MLFSLFQHYLELYITDTALKVSRSLCCFATSVSHGVVNYLPRLWGTGISDAMFRFQSGHFQDCFICSCITCICVTLKWNFYFKLF